MHVNISGTSHIYLKFIYYSIHNLFRWKLILKIQKLRHLRHPTEIVNDRYELMTDYDLMVNHNINDIVSSSELCNPKEEIIQ